MNTIEIRSDYRIKASQSDCQFFVWPPPGKTPITIKFPAPALGLKFDFLAMTPLEEIEGIVYFDFLTTNISGAIPYWDSKNRVIAFSELPSMPDAPEPIKPHVEFQAGIKGGDTMIVRGWEISQFKGWFVEGHSLSGGIKFMDSIA